MLKQLQKGPYYGIQWIEKGTCAERRTKEVHIRAKLSPYGKGFMLVVNSIGDCKHHLVEDSAILLSKMAEEICGHRVG